MKFTLEFQKPADRLPTMQPGRISTLAASSRECLVVWPGDEYALAKFAHWEGDDKPPYWREKNCLDEYYDVEWDAPVVWAELPSEIIDDP